MKENYIDSLTSVQALISYAMRNTVLHAVYNLFSYFALDF